MFGSRTFSAANVMTLLVYAGLGAVLFFLVLQLQTVGGYGALAAGRLDAPDHAVHALPRQAGRRARHPDRAADPDDGRPAGDGRRRAPAAGSRRGRELRARRAAGSHDLRPRPGADGGVADRDRAGGRARRARRDRVGRQQRGRPRRLAAGRRRAPGRGRSRRRAVRRPGRVRRGVRLRDDDLRRPARGGWPGLLVHHPPDRAGVRRRGALPRRPLSRLGPCESGCTWSSSTSTAGRRRSGRRWRRSGPRPRRPGSTTSR